MVGIGFIKELSRTISQKLEKFEEQFIKNSILILEREKVPAAFLTERNYNCNFL